MTKEQVDAVRRYVENDLTFAVVRDHLLRLLDEREALLEALRGFETESRILFDVGLGDEWRAAVEAIKKAEAP